MALRVLLADESTTIKKVMQLALQDFAVEVKSVHAGIDVLDVARSFQPDIIFADVLLQKKNGYEVCAALKQDAELKSIPVILMWSSFMDLDDAQARSCGAEARLEKPFDVETLRKEVLDLVPKTRSQRLAHFLEFSPKLNEDLANDPAAKAADAKAALAPRAPMPPPPPPKSTWSMESFEDPSKLEVAAADQESDEESFQPLELSQLGGSGADHEIEPLNLETEEPSGDDEAWARHDLSQFKLDLPPISVGEGRDEFKIDMGEEEFATPNFETDSSAPEANFSHRQPKPPPARRQPPPADIHEPIGNDLTLEVHEIAAAEDEIELPLEIVPLGPKPRPTPSSTVAPPPGAAQMSAQELERIIRAQSREIIEQVVRKLVPDLAATIIREELERLLEDTAVRDSSGNGGSGTSSRKETRL